MDWLGDDIVSDRQERGQSAALDLSVENRRSLPARCRSDYWGSQGSQTRSRAGRFPIAPPRRGRVTNVSEAIHGRRDIRRSVPISSPTRCSSASSPRRGGAAGGILWVGHPVEFDNRPLVEKVGWADRLSLRRLVLENSWRGEVRLSSGIENR